MGYYDQDYESRYRKKDRNKWGYLLSSLAGAIIGAVIVLIALPQIIDINSPSDGQEARSDNGSSNQTITKNVSLDVNTDITSAVEKAADAVVGITNIQQ